MSIKLFIMTHKPFTPPADPMYVPLHVGRANAPDLGFLGDGTMVPNLVLFLRNLNWRSFCPNMI